ncbi:MAG: hypothetical protein GY731_09670 [Gammaproteobacteria bacterium]|nr:hypothetical protein [Gammaproteobacteria bacterium]
MNYSLAFAPSPATSLTHVAFWVTQDTSCLASNRVPQANVDIRGLYRKHATIGDSREVRFRCLADSWTEKVKNISSFTQITAHPDYLAIISMGRPVIHLLLEELNDRPNYWFAALEAISKENPIPEAHRGNLAQMTEDWIAWGESEGYIDAA